MKKLTETELGYTIVPSMQEATIKLRRFVGDAPEIGNWLVIKGGKLSFNPPPYGVKGVGRLDDVLMDSVNSQLEGKWIICTVDILEDCLELKLARSCNLENN